MEKVKAGQTIKAEHINQFVDAATPTIQNQYGVYDQSNRWNAMAPIAGMDLPEVLTINIYSTSRWADSGLATANYSELIQDGFSYDTRDGSDNTEMASLTSGIYSDTFMIREICDNPTCFEGNQIATITNRTNVDDIVYVYKATASVAPVKVLSGKNGTYRASWQKHNSNNYYFQNIANITDNISGNITIGNIAEFERNYSEDYSVMASGLSGDLSGGFHTWAERISDEWMMNVAPVPNVSGMEVFDIETGQQIVVASDEEYKVWMAWSGDENNYMYGWSFPRLCDV